MPSSEEENEEEPPPPPPLPLPPPPLARQLPNKLMREMLFKILIIGDFGVGKTAIIRRYTEGMFAMSYKLTIGVDFAVKSLVWDDRTVVNLQLWDIAGHERFGYMTSVYYKYAIAAVIVYDLSRPATFDSVVKWLNDVKSKVTLPDGRPIPIIILANKCDIPTVNIDSRSLDKYCMQNEILKWFYTSAKEDININEAIHYLVQKIIQLNCDMDDPEAPPGSRYNFRNGSFALMKPEGVANQPRCSSCR